jgi:nucleotide-binding universal stress UspA family protein
MAIVVATDFSPCSSSAVRLATALARRRGAHLFLLHAVEAPPLDASLVPIGASDWETKLVMAAEVAIAREADVIRKSGVPVETRVLVGTAASVILEAAKGQQAGLIVVGTHGRTRGGRLFLGSVAETVVRSSTCPVLVAREAAPDFAHWESSAPLRLTVATDGSRASQSALSWIGTVAQVGASDLSLVRVYFAPEEAIRYGLDDPWGGPRRDPALLPLLERDLRREAQSLMGSVPERLRFRAASSEASEVLSEEAAMLGADALVIGVPRHRSARWAAIRPGPVLHSTTLPVFCVPEAPRVASDSTSPIRSVLIASDLSEASRDIVSDAYRLLRAGGGHVELCTVHVVGLSPELAEMPLPPPLGERERSALESQLQALVPADASAAGITTHVSVVAGTSAARSILATAERFGVDLIVVGSHGRSGLKRALLGSVAEEIARQSTRPVLLVRSHLNAGRP